MPRLYAVTRSRGAHWNPSLPLEHQLQWREHADFMNALEAEGFVLLGGPLEGTEDALLIIRAESAEQILSRLEADPWSGSEILAAPRIAPWDIRLGSLA